MDSHGIKLLVHTNYIMLTLVLKLKSGTMTGTRSACIIDYQLPSRAGFLFDTCLFVLIRWQEEWTGTNLPISISPQTLIPILSSSSSY